MKKFKEFLIKLIFCLHLPILILGFGPFLIPTSIWPEKIIFHFWYLLIIMLIQFIWSITVFKKFSLVCPLTTLMQLLRGCKLNDKNNYQYPFVAGLLKKLNIHLSYKVVNALLFFALIIVSAQYIWFKLA